VAGNKEKTTRPRFESKNLVVDRKKYLHMRLPVRTSPGNKMYGNKFNRKDERLLNSSGNSCT
jgi:hypothetical protein